jgi:excisionase family DNA binding protein
MPTNDEEHPVIGSSDSFPGPVCGADGTGGTGYGDGTASATLAVDLGPLLYTPAQAAALLQVPESWLRRRAAARRLPCSFLGKHLRFSRADLDAIVAAATVQMQSAAPRARRVA